MSCNDLRNDILMQDLLCEVPHPNKLFGVLSCCRLPIRKSSSRSLPHLNVKSNANCVPLNDLKCFPKLSSLSNLVGRNGENDPSLSKRKKIFQKLLSNQSKCDKLHILTGSDKSKSFRIISKYKEDLNKIRCGHNHKKAIMKKINERSKGRLLNNLLSECRSLQNSFNKINDKGESVKLTNSQSLTTITSRNTPEPLPRQRFLTDYISDTQTLNINESDDTLYGFDESLDSFSLSLTSDQKTSISSPSLYITARSSPTIQSNINNNMNTNNDIDINNNQNKKIFVSVYEKQFQKLQLLYPSVRKLVINSAIRKEISHMMGNNHRQSFIITSINNKTEKPQFNTLTIPIVKGTLICSQQNNNNNNDDNSLDSHEYFRQAQQLLSSNSSQMQYLIYGFENTNSSVNTNNSKMNKVEIRPFLAGERSESPENLEILKSKLNTQMKPLDNTNKLKSTGYYDDFDERPIRPDFKLKITDENKKKSIGPALQSFMDRRQRNKIESQAKDHSLMLSRARMIKSGNLYSEFDAVDEDREKFVHSPDGESSSKTHELIKLYEENLNKNFRNPQISSSSSSEDDRSSQSSTKNETKVGHHREHARYAFNESSCEKKTPDLNDSDEIVSENTNKYRNLNNNKNFNTKDLNSFSSSDSSEDESSHYVDKVVNKSPINNTIKHVQFDDNDGERFISPVYGDKCEDIFENSDRNNDPIIRSKITCVEQQISALTMMLNNVMRRMNNLEMSFHEFSTSFIKLHKEMFDGRQHYSMHNPYLLCQPNYQQINNSMNTTMSDFPFWDNQY